jgi:deazaflavin-dependent oxidoreductase (nitroreductase family)
MPTLNEWNDRIVAEFQANEGLLKWSTPEEAAAGRPVPEQLPGFSGPCTSLFLLLHTIGAKTGRKRINPVAHMTVGDDFAVFGSVGGSPKHPDWYYNVVAHPTIYIEIAKEIIPVTARVAEGEERARIWAKFSDWIPKMGEYQDLTTRKFPVILLKRAS